MTIDDRARAAATDLLERAAQRPVHDVDDLTTAARRPSGTALAAVAASVLLVVGLVVFVTYSDDVSPAMPGGGDARMWAPDGLGLSMQIPASWPDRGPASGFAYSVGHNRGDGGAVADRLHLLEAMDASTIGATRASDLQAFGATDIQTSITEIDGRPAAFHRYRLFAPRTSATKDVSTRVIVTEYDVPLGEWVLIIAVNERGPADQSELVDWILSTIRVHDVPADEAAVSEPLEQPDGPLPVPSGIDTKVWSLDDDYGVTMEVPAGWVEQAPSRRSPTGVGYTVDAPYRQIFPPGGGPMVSVSRISTVDADDREEDIEYEGGVIEATAETVVDGRPTRVLRYRKAPPGYPLRVTAHFEYLIEMGDGDVLMVQTAENAGGEPYAELLRWIRSTIDLT